MDKLLLDEKVAALDIEVLFSTPVDGWFFIPSLGQSTLSGEAPFFVLDPNGTEWLVQGSRATCQPDLVNLAKREIQEKDRRQGNGKSKKFSVPESINDS